MYVGEIISGICIAAADSIRYPVLGTCMVSV